MSWARPCERDLRLPERAGEPELCPPEPAEALALCRAHLARPGEPAPSSARLVYARWKPRTSITTGYTISFPDGAERILALKRYASGKARSVARGYRPDARARRAEDRLRSFAVLEETGTCLYVFPTDRVLPGAARVVDLRRTARHLNALALVPARKFRGRGSSAQLLRYKPERRAVLRLNFALRDGLGCESRMSIAARVLPPVEAQRVLRARSASLERAADAAHLIGPRLLHVEERTGIVLEEWVDGAAFGEADFEHAGPTGALLARLHALPPPSDPAPASEPPLGLEALFAIDERILEQARALLAPPPPRSTAWIHGDLHPDQVVRERAGGATRLLDMDALGPGDPARDLATWVADHLAADPSIGFAEAARPLLEGYAQAGGKAPPERDLAAQVAFQLAVLSASALRRLELGAVVRAGFLLERAGDVLLPRRVRA